MLEVKETDEGIVIGKGLTAKKIKWEELGDLITTLQQFEFDHNSSEKMEHEYESL